MFDRFTNSSASGNAGATAAASKAGKGSTQQHQRSRATPRPQIDPAALLPPFVLTVLLDGDVDDVGEAVRKLHGDQLRAAFNFLRTRRGHRFVERISADVFPVEGMRDFLGIDELLQAPAIRAECSPADSVESDDFALRGIQLALRVDRFTIERPDEAHPPGTFGPERAGPYALTAHSFQNKLVFWTASHVERGQDEWVIGPDSIDQFVRDVDLYVGVAVGALPGSPAVPGSQADGADKPRTPPSLVEDEARGAAPWQQVANAADDMNGGTGLVAAANGAIRLANYELPARQLAARLMADVESGKLGHLDARAQAVDGRNQLLANTRRDISPGAAKASRLLKSDDGVAVAEMQRRKTSELLKNYSGKTKRGKPLDARSTQALREILDADSDLWGHYAKAMEADPTAFKGAMRSLGESPEVSKAIIRSAGRPNRLVTGMATVQAVGGAAGLVLGAIDAYQEIANADEAHKLHAAARAWAGFTGGIIGAEATVWVASALVGAMAGGGVGAPVMIVVSLLAGAAGGAAGAHLGVNIVDLIAEASTGGIMPAHATAAAGGLAGVHSRGTPHGQNLGQSASTAIFKLDEQLARFDRAILGARDRGELQALQRRRLELLEERGNVEELLLAVRAGAFEANESHPEPEPEPELPPSPPPMPSRDCPEDDCDDEVW